MKLDTGRLTPSPLSKTRLALSISAAVFMFGLGLSQTQAAPLDNTDPPPPTDPSAFTNQPADPDAALRNLLKLPPANVGAFDLPNGVVGNRKTPLVDNVLPPDLQPSFNIPTNGNASPVFGAQPFSQKLELFEEFGSNKLDAADPPSPVPFPVPTVGPAPAQDPLKVARSGPSPAALDAFLRQPALTPFPTEFSNVLDRNPLEGADRGFPQSPGRFARRGPATGKRLVAPAFQ